MKCPECSRGFTPRQVEQVFCSAPCHKASYNRGLKRMATIYRALVGWRRDRGRDPRDLTYVCREIRAWLDEDKAAGRSVPRHNHGADRGSLRQGGGAQ